MPAPQLRSCTLTLRSTHATAAGTPGAWPQLVPRHASSSSPTAHAPSAPTGAQDGLTERLDRAIKAGWVPAELREEARQLYLDLHSLQRMHLEEMYGGPLGGRAQ